MKKLLIVLALSLLPVLVNARQWQIGLNAGLVQNTPGGDMNTSTYSSGGFSPTGTFKVLRNINKNWQAGLSVGIVPLTYTAKGERLFFTDVFAPQDDVETVYYKAYIANPAFPVQAEVNHTFRIGVLDLYAGMSAGIFFSADMMFTPFHTADYDIPYKSVGLIGGMQVGGSWFFVPWCGLNMQGGLSYYHPYKTVAFPITAGLRFRL